MTDERKRAHERHDLPGPVPGEVKIYHSMAIRQLSEGGALIEIGVPLQLDSLHDFRLTLGDRSLVVKARVVHSRISTVGSDRLTYRTGIEFVDLSPPVTLALAEFVDALAVQRSGPR
ncbi:MAG: PilZ domain-containing protein [Vicinamibacterales bacterium]